MLIFLSSAGLLQFFVGGNVGIIQRLASLGTLFIAACLLSFRGRTFPAWSRSRISLTGSGLTILLVAVVLIWLPGASLSKKLGISRTEASSSSRRGAGVSAKGVYSGRAVDENGHGIAGLWIYEGDFLNPDPQTLQIEAGMASELLTHTDERGEFEIPCPGSKTILITSMNRTYAEPVDSHANWAWEIARGTGEKSAPPCSPRSDAKTHVTTMHPGAILKGRYFPRGTRPEKYSARSPMFCITPVIGDVCAFQVPVLAGRYIFTGLRTGRYSISGVDAQGNDEIDLVSGTVTIKDWFVNE